MKKNYPNFDKLSDDEKKEIRYALNQADASLLLQAQNEPCRIFLGYLKRSKDSPFQHVDSLFARHKFQSSMGNSPHIHVYVVHFMTSDSLGSKNKNQMNQ